jgi:hypothetical protein
MDNRLTLGTVHFVEWLRPGDGRPGEDLFGEVEPLGLMSNPKMPCRFWRIGTREEFVRLIPKVEDEFRDTSRVPVLHIETHGDGNGIGISDRDRVEWPEFMELLIPLNRLTGLNLVVILAACEGFWGIQMLQPAREAAAFRGLIGPNRRMTSAELSRGCLAFYRAVFDQRDGDVALKAMNDAVDPNRPTFRIVSAEAAFKTVFRHYIEISTPEAIEGRVDKVMQGIREQRRAEGSPGMYKTEIIALREGMRQRLSDHRARFEQMHRDFFFIEQFPENAQRFDLKFEEVAGQ